MDWTTRVRSAFMSTSHTPDDDVIEELAQHARAMYEAARADGCSHEDADRRVADQLDRWRVDAGALQHQSRRLLVVAPPPAVSSSRCTGLLQDVRYAARLLRRQPRHALLTILTMALGIGATTVLFSVAYGVLMKPLPWPHADRIVVLTGNARRQRAAVRRLHQRRLPRLARGRRDDRDTSRRGPSVSSYSQGWASRNASGSRPQRPPSFRCSVRVRSSDRSSSRKTKRRR